MSELTLTLIIFLSITSILGISWILFQNKNSINILKKPEKKPLHPLQIYINKIEEAYEKKSIKANNFRHENRVLKGKLYQEQSRVLTLSDRLSELQGRDFVFHSTETIDELESELKEKEKIIKQLMSQIALTPILKDEKTIIS